MGRDLPQGTQETKNSRMTSKYPKDAMYRCPECVRHYMGGMALTAYKGCCNICGAEIDPKVDRTK